MRRLMGSLLAAGMLATGGATAAALGLGGPAGADDVPSGEAPTGTEEPGRLRQALDGLVGQGTITSEQADAVADALRDKFPRGRRFARHRDVAREALSAAADVVGLDQAELRALLEQGQSLAEVAADKDVTRSDLLAGLTDAASRRLDAAVADGDVSAERAQGLKDRLPAVLDELVDRSFDGSIRGVGRSFADRSGSGPD